ncbi:uncharacterized protein [Antedon mediterranea]|uniref:uncharacterized protein n=1 Tax=Antedon mediterranea TaxID=105859 RepID=UPI003AF5FD58
MDNDGENQQMFEANLSSIPNDFVVLNYSKEPLVGDINEEHLSENHHTNIDEQNLIQSWEMLREENANLKEQLQKLNLCLIKRIEETKVMRINQEKNVEVFDAKFKQAKEMILNLRKENDSYKQRIESILEQLGQIIEREKDPKYKKVLEHISLQIKDEIETDKLDTSNTETVEEVGTQKERKETSTTDEEMTKLNALVAEMSEQLKCKDEQIDLIAKQLSEMKLAQHSPNMISESTETSNGTSESALPESSLDNVASMKNELGKMTSLNTQLTEDLASMKNMHSKNQTEIDALKASVLRYQHIQEEKSKEFERLRANYDKVQMDKDELVKSQTSHQQQSANIPEVTVKSPPSSKTLTQSTEVLVGSAPSTGVKSYKKESNDETVQNLMMLFKTEREKCSSLQEKLRNESKKCHDLEMEMIRNQSRLEYKSSNLDKEMTKREREHELTVEELNKKLDNLSRELEEAKEPRYQSTGENMRALRGQVMHLMRELSEMNAQVANANKQVEKKNERIKSLEMKNSVLDSEHYNQSMQDTAIIDRLNNEVKRLNNEVKRLEKDLYLVIDERNNLLSKCQEFQELYQDVKQNAVDEQALNDITIRLVQSQEAHERKDTHIKELQGMKNQLEDKCSALAAQAEVYKADFEAERQARETAHSERENLLEVIKMKEREMEQLTEDQSPANMQALEDLQRKYGGVQTAHGYPQHTIAPASGQTYGRQEDYYPHPVGGNYHMGTAQPLAQEFKCPVCQNLFPDIDTLQIHVIDCIQ